MSLPLSQQEINLHYAAVEFAYSHFRDKDKPKRSVILTIAENFAEENEPNSDEHERIINAFVTKVDKILDVLRNVSSRVTRQ